MNKRVLLLLSLTVPSFLSCSSKLFKPRLSGRVFIALDRRYSLPGNTSNQSSTSVSKNSVCALHSRLSSFSVGCSKGVVLQMSICRRNKACFLSFLFFGERKQQGLIFKFYLELNAVFAHLERS